MFSLDAGVEEDAVKTWLLDDELNTSTAALVIPLTTSDQKNWTVPLRDGVLCENWKVQRLQEEEIIYLRLDDLDTMKGKDVQEYCFQLGCECVCV